MSENVTLLFLHGVGTGDPDNMWRNTLEAALTKAHYPSFENIDVVAPKYAHALRGADDIVPLPDLTIEQPKGEDARTNRREFERRVGAVEFRLGRFDAGASFPVLDAALTLAIAAPKFEQARKYLQERKIRAQVLTRILEKLPTQGKLVIVAHSLGSVIAADLLRRLPVGLRVAGMVTIGSPLGNASFGVDNLKTTLEDPPINLDWWTNFWNRADPVAAQRGVSAVIPWLVDLRVQTGKILAQAHEAVDYLAHPSVAEAVGFAVFGSKSKALVKVDHSLDIPLDEGERLAILALRYAHLAKGHLTGEKQQRFAGALRRVQATAVDDIRERNKREGRPLPAIVARLAFDYSDPSAPLPEPDAVLGLSKEEAVVTLTVLASENVIRPFEITLPRNAWRDAMKDLTSEMALSSKFGEDVFDASKAAEAALSGGPNWFKIGALSVGAAAIVLATGGLALAVGPGLVGAAAITSALASFGPGGMIGGLLTAGTLVSAGGGGIAFGLAGSGTDAATLGAVLERRLAAEILRKEQDLDQDPGTWFTLVETEIEVRRQYERMDEFSDPSAPSLKDLKRKIELLERALKYLRDKGLEPGAADASSGDRH